MFSAICISRADAISSSTGTSQLWGLDDVDCPPGFALAFGVLIGTSSTGTGFFKALVIRVLSWASAVILSIMALQMRAVGYQFCINGWSSASICWTMEWFIACVDELGAPCLGT